MTTAPRRKRFTRGAAAPLRLTADDLALISAVARYRFLTSRHLQRLLPHRSGKKLIERLSLLFHHGYLDRPRAQLTYFATGGSTALVYGLGYAGARVLAARVGFPGDKLDWSWKNRSVGPLYIEHTLLIADFMVGLTCAARQLIDLSEGASLPLRVRLPELTSDLTVVPDRVFALTAADGRRKYFFLEADRATMPVTRSDLRQSSVLRKFRCYLAGGGRDNAFGQQLGIDNFRVLLVTSSQERIGSMLAVLKSLTGGKGSRQFLFTDENALHGSATPLDLVWIDGKGERVRLLD